MDLKQRLSKKQIIIGLGVAIFCIWFFASDAIHEMRDTIMVVVWLGVWVWFAIWGIKKKKSYIISIGGGLFVGLIGLFLVWFVAETVDSSYKEQAKRSEGVYNSSWDSSVRQVKDYLQNNLKDPKSFEAIEWSKVAKTESGFMVRCKYRAKNSFGGYVIEDKIFLLDKSGRVVSAFDYQP